MKPHSKCTKIDEAIPDGCKTFFESFGSITVIFKDGKCDTDVADLLCVACANLSEERSNMGDVNRGSPHIRELEAIFGIQ